MPLPRRSLSGYGHSRRVFNALAACCLLAGLLAGLPKAPAAAEPPVIVALGDSLTAGYGLPPEQAFPARLEAWLRARGVPAKVQNAGVSGDTTAGGRARLGWALAGPVDAVIVELGANDMLRGVDPAETEANLDAILGEIRARGIKVLLAGMYAQRNLGREYVQAFDAIFPRLAEKHGVPLYPFFLDGIAQDRQYNLQDGMHPNGRGIDIIVERIGPQVMKLIAAE